MKSLFSFVSLLSVLCLSFQSLTIAQDSANTANSQTSAQLAAMALTIGEMKQQIQQQNKTIEALRDQIITLSKTKTPRGETMDKLLSFKYRPRLRTVVFTFSNDTKPTMIPGSERASFCALTYVNDITEAGSCKVFLQNSAWHVQSGDGFEGNNCAAACLFLD
ncbi:hypothetical protein N9K16_00365 [Alphaproteobacteria bacterium]|nr:hypothetical protein [Alphaproteobacteria bacterium]